MQKTSKIRHPPEFSENRPPPLAPTQSYIQEFCKTTAVHRDELSNSRWKERKYPFTPTHVKPYLSN